MKAMVASLLAGVVRMSVVRYRDAARKWGERFIRQYVFPDAIGAGGYFVTRVSQLEQRAKNCTSE